MKHKYFIHVLVTLVLVASMLVSLTSGAMGKYTNAGLGVFSTLASVYFSDYKVVGSIIVDDGSGGSIEPDEESDSVWGAGEDIVNAEERPNYGWEDAGDISFVLTNDTEQTLYLTAIVTIALPHYPDPFWTWIFVSGQLVVFSANYTLTLRNTETSDEQTFGGYFNTSDGYFTKNPDRTDSIYTINDYPHYLYDLSVRTDLVIEPGNSYECHFSIGNPSIDGGNWLEEILSSLSQMLTNDAAYYSIKITARTDP